MYAYIVRRLLLIIPTLFGIMVGAMVGFLVSMLCHSFVRNSDTKIGFHSLPNFPYSSPFLNYIAVYGYFYAYIEQIKVPDSSLAAYENAI